MAQAKPKLVFDLDGTLIDISKRHHKVYSEVVEELGGRPLPQASYWQIKRHKVTWTELLEKSKLSPDLQPQFLEAFITKIENPNYLKIDTLLPGALEVLKEAAQKHACYLLSLRRKPENLLAEVEWLGINKYFQKVLTGHSKTEGFDKKIEILRAQISQNEPAVIVGDTEADIMAGQALNFTTIAVLSGIRDREFLTNLKPDFIIDSIKELPNLGIL